MSEFVKQIVQEVMNRHGIRENTTRKTKTSTSHGILPSNDSEQVVINVSRPNYQREKKDKRLKPLGTPNTADERTVYRIRDNQKQKNTFSQLKQISLVQGKKLKQDITSPTVSKDCGAKFIGKTRRGSCVWFFPIVRPTLKPLFNVSANCGSVGVITANSCYPGQLFLIEEVLREIPIIQYHLEWENEKDHPFVCELLTEDKSKLERMIKTVYQKLNRMECKGVDAYEVVSPSAWLTRCLELDQSVQALGVVEGLSYYRSLQLIDHYVQSQSDERVQFKIAPHYMLLVGEYETISDGLEWLKQNLDSSIRY